MSELDQLYLDNIDEYVNDQDKIVTYKWLSLTLGVHVNTAKQMLFHYLEQKRRESSSALHATFLLSGKSVDDGRTCHKVCVVREEELEEAKSRLAAVASVHVYSVHKALLRDSSPLFGVDYDAVKTNIHQCNKFSAIHCPDAVPLSKAELQQSREPRPQTVDPPKPQTQTGSRPAPKPKGIMGIFANRPKTEIKTEPKTKPRLETKPEAKPEPSEEPVNEAPKPASKSNHMANFFGNQTNKKPARSLKEPSHSPIEQRPLKDSRDQRSKSKRVESDSEEEPQEEKKKKRRRIRKPQSDSSDDEATPGSPVRTKSPVRTRIESPEKEREEPVAAVPAPEEESVVPDTPPQTENPTRTRKRRRVLKSKTFIDDEGCIVTEKVYESESYSEDEEAQTKPGSSLGLKPYPKAAPVRAQEEKKKGGGGAKATRQASIMGFFTKK